MATTLHLAMNMSIASSWLTSSSHDSSCSQPKTFSYILARNRSTSVFIPRATIRKEDVVIVGGGIAGLASAVSLQRLGIKSLVLEQADSLRTGGTSLTLFKNAWKVLDSIGVGDELRSQFLEIQGMEIRTEKGKRLRSFRFKDVDESQEVRAVERKLLLKTLADQLPSNGIQYSSRLANIESSGAGETLIELVNGTKLSAKIVIGCDGVRSSVAKWMGFAEPKYSGHYAFRGLAYFPSGHSYEPRVQYIYGRGVRAGYVPVSRTKVYWFICYNSSSLAPRVTDPSQLMKQAGDLIKSWPSDMLELLEKTPEDPDMINRLPFMDRWLWPAITPPPSKGKVVVVGDAWHPMTPNLGQGGCCALEDAVILARKLSAAMKSGEQSVEEALKSYGKERWPRIFPITVQANLVGKLLQWENPDVCYARNEILVPKFVQIGPLLKHTNYDPGVLVSE